MAERVALLERGGLLTAETEVQVEMVRSGRLQVQEVAVAVAAQMRAMPHYLQGMVVKLEATAQVVQVAVAVDAGREMQS